ALPKRIWRSESVGMGRVGNDRLAAWHPAFDWARHLARTRRQRIFEKMPGRPLRWHSRAVHKRIHRFRRVRDCTGFKMKTEIARSRSSGVWFAPKTAVRADRHGKSPLPHLPLFNFS